MDHLKKLAETKDDNVVFKAKNPRRLAYRLRQAINYINTNDTEFGKFKFSVIELSDSVLCRRKIEEFSTLVETVIEYGEPVPSITTLEEVIGYVVTNKHPSLYFINFTPTPKELDLLKKWGATQEIEFSLRNNKLLAKRENA